MRQFNLDEYIKNPSLGVVTREGRPVRIVCTDAKGDYPVVALAIDDDGSEYTVRCRQDGIGGFDEDDLFFETVKNEEWVNLYRYKNGFKFFGDFYETEEDARKAINEESGIKHIATIKLTLEE